jgi:hypothetical protein
MGLLHCSVVPFGTGQHGDLDVILQQIPNGGQAPRGLTDTLKVLVSVPVAFLY